mmetsp:Transcript_2939/g.5070  ORF Transcript_2939/g.5070 Transcript_2939/m.5070 type:complete len:376 (-) Transcript_2939:306-1433(-)
MKPSNKLASCLVLLSFVCLITALNDYWGHFCGRKNCYDLLGVDQSANKTEIKKAYRTLSLEYHPDKNPTAAAKEHFQNIAKAYEVMMNDTHRELYNHLMEHPDEYWVEYGHYFFMDSAAQTDLLTVIIGILVFVSILAPVFQNSRFQRAQRYLVKAAVEGWNLRSGGSRTTLELRRLAEENLTEKLRQATNDAPITSKKKGGKMKKPRFSSEELEKEILELVKNVEIEGGFKKPTIWDVPIVKIFMLPVSGYNAVVYHYKYDYLKMELPYSEKERLSVKRMGFFWDDLEDEEREALIKNEIWKPEIFEEWRNKKMEEEKRILSKKKKKYAKTKGINEEDDSDGYYDEDSRDNSSSKKVRRRKKVAVKPPTVGDAS